MLALLQPMLLPPCCRGKHWCRIHMHKTKRHMRMKIQMKF